MDIIARIKERQDEQQAMSSHELQSALMLYFSAGLVDNI
jgi:hypothetical protein